MMNEPSHGEVARAWLNAARSVNQIAGNLEQETNLPRPFIYGNYVVICALLADHETREVSRAPKTLSAANIVYEGLYATQQMRGGGAPEPEVVTRNLFSPPLKRLFLTYQHAKIVDSPVAAEYGYGVDGYPIRLNEQRLVEKYA